MRTPQLSGDADDASFDLWMRPIVSIVFFDAGQRHLGKQVFSVMPSTRESFDPWAKSLEEGRYFVHMRFSVH